MISNSGAEIDALVSARHRADLAAAVQVAVQAEELARRRKTAAAEAQAAADSAKAASARAREALLRSRAGDAKRLWDSATATTRPAPTRHFHHCWGKLLASGRFLVLPGPFRRSSRPSGPGPGHFDRRHGATQ